MLLFKELKPGDKFILGYEAKSGVATILIKTHPIDFFREKGKKRIGTPILYNAVDGDHLREIREEEKIVKIIL